MLYRVINSYGEIYVIRQSIEKERKIYFGIAFLGLFLLVSAWAYQYAERGFFLPLNDEILQMMLAGSLIALVPTVYALFFLPPLLRAYPELISFNNKKAYVEITHEHSTVKKARIPYQDIERVYIRSIQGQTNQGESIFQNRYYCVFMELKDGSTWDLTEPSKFEMMAESDYKKILENVKFDSSFEDETLKPEIHTEELSIRNVGEEVQIKWKRQTKRSQVVWNRVLIALLILNGIIALNLMANPDEGKTWPETFRIIWKELPFLSVERLTELFGVPMLCLLVVACILITIIFINSRRIKAVRKKENIITLNRSAITSNFPEANIPISSIGHICFTYGLTLHRSKWAQKYIFLNKEKSNFKPISNTMVHFSQAKDLASFTKESFDFFSKSFKDFYSRDIEQEYKKLEANRLADLIFEELSPIDMLYIYRAIKEKLNIQERLEKPVSGT